MITVCRLVPWKGVDRLIQLLAHLPNTRLVVVGDGPHRDQLKQQARTLRVHDRLVLLGAVPQHEVANCLSQGDVFVLNSTYEGLPHVVLEAMAAGIPVVATNAGGSGEVVQHERTGLLVSPTNMDQLRDAVVRLCSHRAFATQLAAEAKRHLTARFGFKGMADATENLLIRVALRLRSEAGVFQDAEN